MASYVTVVVRQDMYLDDLLKVYASGRVRKGLNKIYDYDMEEDFLDDMEEAMGKDFGWDEVDEDEIMDFFESDECMELIDAYLKKIENEETDE